MNGPQDELRQGDSRPDPKDDWRHDDLIVLATFDNAPEAHCLRIELENQGINAAVANEQSSQSVGASLFGRISAIWIEVLVLKKDAEAALEIKTQFLEHSKTTKIPVWQCKCGETVDAGFAQCWSCMQPYETMVDPD